MWWTRVKHRASVRERAVDDHPRCRGCDGACCRSFAAVELTGAEYLRLEALGASRLQLSLRGPHWLVIEGGCEFLVDGRCAIYGQRPDVCRRFLCDDEAGIEAPAPGAGAGGA
jgi:Fe-S-cluster containining protein